MHSRRISGSALAFILLTWPSFAQAPPSTGTNPVIRVEATAVPVGIAVTDSRGRPIQGLQAADFTLLDNGREQPISFFAAKEEPAYVVLLIENTVGGALFARAGMSPFVIADSMLSKMPGSTRIAVVTFSDVPRVATDFTSIDQARATLKELHMGSFGLRAGSALMNLSASVAATINWLEARQANPTIILFSTGLDTSPAPTWAPVQQRLATSNVRLLAVSIFGEFRKLPKAARRTADGRREWTFVKEGIAAADQWMQRVSAATGGRAYAPRTAKDFGKSLSEITLLACGGYQLMFTPTALDGQLHSIQIKPKRSAYRVHHRQAYLAEARLSPVGNSKP